MPPGLPHRALSALGCLCALPPIREDYGFRGKAAESQTSAGWLLQSRRDSCQAVTNSSPCMARENGQGWWDQALPAPWEAASGAMGTFLEALFYHQEIKSLLAGFIIVLSVLGRDLGTFSISLLHFPCYFL